MWDKDYRLIDRSVDTRRKEHNRRVEDAARRRVERIHERQQEAMQRLAEQAKTSIVVQHEVLPTADNSNLARFVREALRRTGSTVRLFHFSLQFGRLRIELSRASGQKNPGAPL